MEDCDDQADCLEWSIEEVVTSTTTEYEVCFWYDKSLTGCVKQNNMDYLCYDDTETTSWGSITCKSSNAVCQTVGCGEIGFGVMDGEDCSGRIIVKL